ncbi:MAG TPA: LytTR family DNA-binding domain-containing protein [Saprospiraceae bacterium]|nr:LytTR family DNA-binding domain-containing protein [Saprospiraceae bacterium]
MTTSAFRALIADDEPGARSTIKSFLQQGFPNIRIIGEVGGVDEAVKLIRHQPVDLLFLDIELEDGTGFDLLDRLLVINFNVIFTTAHNEFAIKAFRYNAIDYLLKPIDPEEFGIAVNKAIQYNDQGILRKQFDQLLSTTKKKSFDRITLTTSLGHVFTNTKDIIRIETYGNYSFVFLPESERLLVSRNLKEFEEMLPEPDFFRIHQSHIINTSQVKKYLKDDGGYVVMADETKIPISRRRKEDFIIALKRYLPSIS